MYKISPRICCLNSSNYQSILRISKFWMSQVFSETLPRFITIDFCRQDAKWINTSALTDNHNYYISVAYLVTFDHFKIIMKCETWPLRLTMNVTAWISLKIFWEPFWKAITSIIMLMATAVLDGWSDHCLDSWLARHILPTKNLFSNKSVSTACICIYLRDYDNKIQAHQIFIYSNTVKLFSVNIAEKY